MAYGRGHVRRTPRTTRTAQAWYDAIAEEHIRRIEQDWQERRPTPQPRDEAPWAKVTDTERVAQ